MVIGTIAGTGTEPGGNGSLCARFPGIAMVAPSGHPHGNGIRAATGTGVDLIAEGEAQDGIEARWNPKTAAIF